MTIRESIEAFIRSSGGRLAPNTVQTYRRNLNQFALWLGTDRTLDAVTVSDIEEFQLYLSGRCSEKTRDNYANTLRTYFKYWHAHRRTTVAWEMIKGPRVPEKIRAFITPGQFLQLDDRLNEQEYYQLTQKVIFHLLWNTGMRIGELLSLNIADIDPGRNGAYILTEKSKRMRIAIWDARCHELLIRYLGVRMCMNQAPELFQTPPNSRNKKRTRLTARSVQRWCKYYGKTLGFPIHPHAFRHGKCHYIIENGGSRHDVQGIAGHSSIVSSEPYVRLNFREQVRLQERFLPAYKHQKPSLEVTWPYTRIQPSS